MKAAIILALMCFLVPPERQRHNGEEADAARGRYQVIARAIASVAESRTEALYLVTVARHESSFAEPVHSGEVRGDDGRSHGLFQELCGRGDMAECPGGELAKDIQGTGEVATARATASALRLLRRAVGKGASPADVFARYGGVRDRDDPRIRARVATFQRLRRRTAKEGNK